MFIRLISGPRLCSRLSGPGAARLRTQQVLAHHVWTHGSGNYPATPRRLPGRRCASSFAAGAGAIDPPESRATYDLSAASFGEEAQPEEITLTGELLDTSETKQLGRAVDSKWQRRDINTVLERIAAIEEARQKESLANESPYRLEDRGPYFTDYTYWAHLSYLLSVAFNRVDDSAQRALDQYRSRAAAWFADDQKYCRILSNGDYMSILAGSLATSARQTLDFFGTLERWQSDEKDGHLLWRVEFYIIADCCYHLRQTPTLWTEIEGDAQLQAAYNQQITRLKLPDSWPNHGLKARYLDLLLKQSTPEESRNLLLTFEQKYPMQNDRDLLYMMDRYTSLGDVDRALGILSRISPALLQSGNEHCIFRCVNLLKLDSVEGEYSSHSFRILPKMLKLGVPPLDIIHNMVVQNAAKSGLLEVSFDLYNHLQAENIAVHGHTYTALLKYSFMLRDVQAMNKVFNIIHAHESLGQNAYLLITMMNIVRHICYFERRASPAACLEYIMQIYDRAYSRHALAKIGILDSSQIQGGKAEVVDPPPIALAGTIWACVLVQRDVHCVHRIWETLTWLLENGDPLVSQVVRETGLFRAFLVFYSRRSATLNHAVAVLQYLLEKYPQWLSEAEWTIVLAGFIKHGGDQSAEQIRQVMLGTGQTFTSQSMQFLLKRWPDSSTVRQIIAQYEAGGLPSGRREPTETLSLQEPASATHV